jgi:anti-anti-sigma factor
MLGSGKGNLEMNLRIAWEGRMVISSRTPEGAPNYCQVCGTHLTIEPSIPARDAPCPRCGNLVWFARPGIGNVLVVKPADLFRPESLNLLFELVELTQGMQLVVDFRDVQAISSAALGRLINIKKKVAAVRGKLRLRGIDPDLREVFRITRLDQVIEIVD